MWESAFPIFFTQKCTRPSAHSLALLARVVNNPVDTVMRLTYALAIALCLNFPVAGMAVRQQESASPAKAVGKAPAVPAPSKAALAADKKAGENVEKKKRDATSPNASAPKRSVKHRKIAARAPYGPPRKIVVREGGASEPTERIAPGMTPAEAVRQRQDTKRLLGATDDQLKRLAERSLDTRQQEMAGQIRNYMEGARKALQEGDLRRASTLALKANLLAEDLQKH